MKSQKYWENRTVERLLDAEQIGENAIPRIISIYEQAQRNIERDIKSIYENYAEKGILEVKELRKAAKNGDVQEFLRKIGRMAEDLGLDPDKVYDERYLTRLDRLQLLQEQIKIEVMSVAPREENISEEAYTQIIQDSYSQFQSDVLNMGVSPSFTTLDTPVVTALLNSKWQGGNWSPRVWSNTSQLALELPTLIGGAIESGQSYQKTIRQVRERFEVAHYKAARLVRTETNYFNSIAELQGYVDDGIEEYEIVAILDSRTSDICESQDGRRYKVTEAVPGQTINPFHPNCRTTHKAVIAALKDIPHSDYDRTVHLEQQGENEAKEKWQKAMQSQMDPNKQAHDYNAEMNRITQELKGKELEKAIDELMSRVPEDYSLRPALEKVAELNGWEKLDINAKAVKKQFDANNWDFSKVDLSKNEAKLLVDENVLLEDLQGLTDTSGEYNHVTKIMRINSQYLDAKARASNNPDAFRRTFTHELGHVVDYANDQALSGGKLFEPSLFPEYTEQNAAILRYRVADSMSTAEVREFVKSTPLSEFTENLEKLQIKTNTGFAFTSEGSVSYMKTPKELFAEAYSIYHVEPDYLKEFAPDIFDLIDKL